ncbi:hypothetical protein BC826DRAFT_1113939 [Russula brevipes]|nr:hypothetical protein BC826DRAFT_1113939 [Russula brevipes]
MCPSPSRCPRPAVSQLKEFDDHKLKSVLNEGVKLKETDDEKTACKEAKSVWLIIGYGALSTPPPPLKPPATPTPIPPLPSLPPHPPPPPPQFSQLANLMFHPSPHPCNPGSPKPCPV